MNPSTPSTLSEDGPSAVRQRRNSFYTTFGAATLSLGLGACTPDAPGGSSATWGTTEVTGDTSTSTGENPDTTSSSTDPEESTTTGDDTTGTFTSGESTGVWTTGTTETSTTTTSGGSECGDGVLDEGEACDDGNDINDDECSNACEENYCGDGIIQEELGEECDENGNNCSDNCEFGMYLFITPDVFYGSELGGYEGAEAICNKMANELSLPGTYQPWLAGQKYTPKKSLTYQFNGEYINIDGSVIAESWNDLTSCDENDECLQEAIMPPEDWPYMYGVYWSNVNKNGEAVETVLPELGHCFEWSSLNSPPYGNSGRFGEGFTGPEWTNWGVYWVCHQDALPLACIQVGA